MNTNGASRCPVCNMEPLLTQEPYSDPLISTYRLECPKHGYSAGGDTLEKVITHWNRYITFMIVELANQKLFGLSPLNTSPCLYCKEDTPGEVFSEPMRYWVECGHCRMVKYEKSA